MDDRSDSGRWQVDGKWFRCDGRRIRPQMVTFGPFPERWSRDVDVELARVASAGFGGLRLFEMPDTRLLDAAARHGLRVFAGLSWAQHADFIGKPMWHSAAMIQLAGALREVGSHPALAGVYVGNEIPADLVRWMGPSRVRSAIEELISLGRSLAPWLLFAYGNYPSTEYLEPENADFTAFNLYLEDSDSFRGYLRRLHHIAGDRPLVVSEFGLDSRRNGLERQAETLSWARRTAIEEACAGFTVYAWSDAWWNDGAEVADWDFGLTDRQGNAKPALAVMASAAPPLPEVRDISFSLIVCTRNGRTRIGRCLRAIAGLRGASFETIVVDDGSSDDTADWVAAEFPGVRLLGLDACGLSAARNAGAAVATGDVLAFTDDDCEPDPDWLTWLARVHRDGRFAAVGGPNLPPPPQSWQQAVVAAAPGAPSHVMIDDEEAEHLPGCNLSVCKRAYHAVGGFDAAFETAGDDVDFCWRLRAAGYRLGFAPGAVVWHHRRPSIAAFLRQQAGYGRAERLLMAKHPQRFADTGAIRWLGFVYGGGPVTADRGSIIYHGEMGLAGYQSICNRMLPLRGLDVRFDEWRARLALAWVKFLAPIVRSWTRQRRIFVHRFMVDADQVSDEVVIERSLAGTREENLHKLMAKGWKPCGPTEPWDLSKPGIRLLLAEEQIGVGQRHTLVRVCCAEAHLRHLDLLIPWNGDRIRVPGKAPERMRRKSRRRRKA